MENIFFIALVVIVGLVRLISQIVEKKKNAEAERRTGLPPTAGTTPVQRAPAQSEEERIRRFMEALGVPTTSAPPPPVQPRPPTPQAAAISTSSIPLLEQPYSTFPILIRSSSCWRAAVRPTCCSAR